MDSFSQYRDRIGQTLTLRLADAMENGQVNEDETAEIADTILKGVNGATNHDELVSFLEELAHRWTMFGPVLIAEQTSQISDDAKKHDEEAVEKVESLLKENRIDEAIETAEKANEESVQQEEALSPPPPQAINNEDTQQQGGTN